MKLFTGDFSETFRGRACEWLLALVMFSLGWRFALPDDTFSVGPTFAGLANMASEPTWAKICLAGGGLRLAALIVNGAFWPTYHIRTGLAVLSCMFWWAITQAFLLSGGPIGISVCFFPAFFVFEVHNAIRAAQDAAQAHNRIKKIRARHDGRTAGS